MAQANPFDQFDSQVQPVPVRQLQPIIGSDPFAANQEQREQQRLDMEAERLRIAQAEEARKAEEAERKRAAAATGRDISDIRAELMSVVDAAKRAKELSDSWFATGFGAERARSMGGTAAADVAALLDTIGGNIAFDRLSRMRAESPTGGALGNVTERELALLQSTVASLNQAQSDEQFKRSMDKVIESYERILAKLPGEEGAPAQPPAAAQAPATREAAAGEAFLTERDKELQDKLSQAYASGATLAELQALAQQYGQTVPLASQEELDAARAQGRGIVVTPTGRDGGDAEYQSKVTQAADQLERQLGEAGFMELATQGMTLGLSDEAGGLGRAIGQLLTGDFNVADNYTFGRDVEREVLRRARERTGVVGTATELLGGGGAVRAVGNIAMNAGRAVAASGQPVTRGAIQSQMARDAATEGALVGGTAGFGYGEGAEESLAGAGIGALSAAGLGTILQRIANRRANRGRGGGGGAGGSGGGGSPSSGAQVIQSAEEFNRATGANLAPLPADTGGAITRRASSAVAQTTFGAKPIVEAAELANTEARAGIRTLAGRQGAVPSSRQAAGEIAAKGAKKVIKSSGTKVNVLYANAKKAAQGVELELPMARTVLQSHIDELSRIPGGAEGLSTLQELANSITGRAFPVDGIKAMRTQLRDKFIKDGLRGSDLERRVNEVVDAAEMDIEDGLIALGKEDAARAYQRASEAAAQRFDLIDNVLEPVIGATRNGRSGEEVFAAIELLSRGDAVTLGKFMRALPEDEAGSIKAAIIDRLGRVSRGRQDATGEAFSLNDFLTRWNDEGLSREAKDALFSKDTRAALDALARVAQGTKEGQRFANFSNTGGANAFNIILNGAPFGAAAGGIVPVAIAGGVSITSQVLLGRLLASPKFARWLAKMPEQKTEKAVLAHIDRLSNIAAADAAIAGDIAGFRQALLGAFRQGAAPVAAENQNEGSSAIRVEIK